MGGIEFVDCRIRDQRNRNPIAMTDATGNGLVDVTGSLKLETDQQTRNVDALRQGACRVDSRPGHQAGSRGSRWPVRR